MKYLFLLIFLGGCMTAPIPDTLTQDVLANAMKVRAQQEAQRTQRINSLPCTKNAFAAQGMSDGMEGRDRLEKLGNQCPNFQKIYTEYQNSYVLGRKEYLKSAANNPQEGQPMNTQPMCLTDNWGNKSCGYNCLKTSTEIKCAALPHHVCVEDFGRITCGYNCRKDFGSIKCDKDPTQHRRGHHHSP